MWKMIDITGKPFGRLVAIKPVGKNKSNSTLWLCKCSCGNMPIIDGRQLRDGITKSCGCIKHDILMERNTKHGMAKTRFYKIWKGMVARCNRKQDHLYGGRGILRVKIKEVVDM